MSQTAAGLSILSNNFPAANLSAFGDLVTAQIEPLVQLDWVYGINSQTGTSTTANSATVDTNGGRLRCQSGTNSAGTAIFASRRSAKYRPGQGVIARFTAAFTTGVASSTQIAGVGNAENGYFVGYSGTTFGIFHRNAGGDTFTPQSSWNGDKCDGTGASAHNINTAYGNVYMISYPFLGYGAIRFFVLTSMGAWVLAHTIAYPNTSATLQLSNANLQFYVQALNSGNTSNLTVYSGSAAVLLTGPRSFMNNPRYGLNASKASITTETNIIALKNCSTFNGVTNRSLMRLTYLSWGVSTNNQVGTVRLMLNPTLGGSPSYSAVNGTPSGSPASTITGGHSVALYDTAGTTTTGGTCLWASSLYGLNPQALDLTPYDIVLAPGDVLSVAVSCGGAATCPVGINWSEDI